jgi:hypothetical protein
MKNKMTPIRGIASVVMITIGLLPNLSDNVPNMTPPSVTPTK